MADGGIGACRQRRRPTLYRTSDGGATWQPLAVPGKDDFWSQVVFTDAQVGEALVQVGARGAAVWRTTHWTRIPNH